MHRILWKTCRFHYVAEDYVRNGSKGCMERVHGPTHHLQVPISKEIFFSEAFQENHDFIDF